MRDILPAFVALLFIIGTAVPVRAQYALPDSDKEKDAAGYKLAVGLSFTAIQGDETAFKTKYFASRTVGLETQAAWVKTTGMDICQLYLSFIWQPYLPDMGLLKPYIGIGPAANILCSYPQKPEAVGEIAYFGVIPYGLEYTFAAIPVAVSFDCKIPFVELLSKKQLRQAELYTTIGFGAKLLLRGNFRKNKSSSYK